MSTPDTTFYNVVLHVGATVNGKVITLQEAIPAHHWGTLTPDAKEGIKSMLRRELGVAIGTSLDFPVTVTRGEHQVMTTTAAAPGHGGSVRVINPVELERGRRQLVEAMSTVSKKRYWAEWERNLDRSLHSEGGMWEILGRTVGWPVGEWKPLTWMSWDDAGALYTSGTVAAG